MSEAAPFLMRALPRRLIVGSFFALTLPLSALLILRSKATLGATFDTPLPVLVYVYALGLTHFLLTFAVYLSAANRRHFVSSWRNVAMFLIAPLAPFVFFAFWNGLALDARFVGAALALGYAVRSLDFLHLSRQSFGVLQLFKGRTSGMPRWTVRVENAYFLSLAVLLFTTFLNGSRFDARSKLVWLAVAVSAALLVTVLVSYGLALRNGGNRQLVMALVYLTLQTLASLLAVYQLGLYSCALAIHYVEYHLIMGQRVFRGPITAEDQALAAVRRRPLLLYGAIFLGVMLVFGVETAKDTATRGSTNLLIHLFDGLFVFHYVLEMSIWKFRDPYFRGSIGPLYS